MKSCRRSRRLKLRSLSGAGYQGFEWSTSDYREWPDTQSGVRYMVFSVASYGLGYTSRYIPYLCIPHKTTYHDRFRVYNALRILRDVEIT